MGHREQIEDHCPGGVGGRDSERKQPVSLSSAAVDSHGGHLPLCLPHLLFVLLQRPDIISQQDSEACKREIT